MSRTDEIMEEYLKELEAMIEYHAPAGDLYDAFFAVRAWWRLHYRQQDGKQ
jgi:hypothetical protein